MPQLWGNPTQVERTQHRKEAIRSTIRGLIEANRLTEDFTLLDLACGRAEESLFLSLQFPKARVVALDVEVYDEWSTLPGRVSFLVQDMLSFFQENPVCPVDVVLFLDSYRNFTNTGYEVIPEYRITIDRWLKANARYMISSGEQTFRSEELPYMDTGYNVLKLVYPKEG
jgi:trans-aconitate methyltransferase